MVDKKKIATEGFVFLLDYNENRMLNEGYDKDNGEDSFRDNEKEALIYVQTIGKNNQKIDISNMLLNYFGCFCQAQQTANSILIALFPAFPRPQTIGESNNKRSFIPKVLCSEHF